MGTEKYPLRCCVVGSGGVVPHAADTVLDNFYGDCKDHVTLLEAMLTAVGIESSPALINSGNAYHLPTAPALGTINHVITYIPSLDLYLDPTAAQTEFGYLRRRNWGNRSYLQKRESLQARLTGRQGRSQPTSKSELTRPDLPLSLKPK